MPIISNDYPTIEKLLVAQMIADNTLIDEFYVRPYLDSEEAKEVVSSCITLYRDLGRFDVTQLVVDLNKTPKAQNYVFECVEYTIATNSVTFNYYQELLKECYKQKQLDVLYGMYKKDKLTMQEYIQSITSLNNLESVGEIKFDSYEEICKMITEDSKQLEFNMFRGIANRFGFAQNVLYIIGAKPSVGKTGVSLNLAHDLASVKDKNGESKYQIVYFSCEMPKPQIVSRLVGIDQNICPRYWINPEYDYVNNRQYRMDNDSKYAKGCQNIANQHYFILHGGQSTNSIRATINKAIKETGKHVVAFVDTINYITPTQKFNGQFEKITNATQELQLITQELDCTIFVLAHLRRETNEMSMSALKGSGELEQSAATIILMERDEDMETQEREETELRFAVVKSRNGTLGGFAMMYNKPTQQLRFMRTKE